MTPHVPRCRLCGRRCAMAGEHSFVPCETPCLLESPGWWGHSWDEHPTCSVCQHGEAILRARGAEKYVCLACLPVVGDTRTLLHVLRIVGQRREKDTTTTNATMTERTPR